VGNAESGARPESRAFVRRVRRVRRGIRKGRRGRRGIRRVRGRERSSDREPCLSIYGKEKDGRLRGRRGRRRMEEEMIEEEIEEEAEEKEKVESYRKK
jgi:hypothetical protein